MGRSTMTTPAAAALLVLALPAAALAGAVTVDHGHGPTNVHDATYADVETQVHSWASDGRTEIRLMVDGLPAGRRYGAHVHLKPCGSLATDSGGHYQHGDVALPLSEREIWLDFTTDGAGHGVGRALVPWLIGPGPQDRSWCTLRRPTRSPERREHGCSARPCRLDSESDQ
jgi:superoxide dismutase, Cu-Zn family